MINLEDLRERKAVNCFTHDFNSIPDEIKSSGKIFVRMTASPLVDLLFKKNGAWYLSVSTPNSDYEEPMRYMDEVCSYRYYFFHPEPIESNDFKLVI